MNSKIKRIYLSSESQKDREDTQTDENTDVVVQFEEGDTYAATFFAYKDIDRLRRENQESGENLGGKYFWAERMVLVERCSKEEIEEIVYQLIENGDFWMVFRKL